jgi:hypothetical protein
MSSKQENSMTVASVSRANAHGLPPALQTAQAAMQIPEVQEMLRKLSAHRLGIFMPHQHDEGTGEFQPLPDEVVQLESCLAVSFPPLDEIARQSASFLPVGWVWRAGAASVAAVCEMVNGDDQHDTEQPKHKMPPKTESASQRSDPPRR